MTRAVAFTCDLLFIAVSMKAFSSTSAVLLLVLAGCDPVGRENGRGQAVPDVAPPRVTPVEILPPKIERSPTGRVVLVDPPRADATQVDLLQQSDGFVDILWVVDDSGSMANERRRLVTNFNSFVQALLSLKVNFQMGVTSIVFNDGGKLRGSTKVISNLTPNPQAVFAANTTFPASRSRWEQGLRMSQFALTSPNITPGGPNAGLLRPNAALAIIVVTNEDDSSFGTTDYFARAFRSLKGPGNESLVTFSTIAGTLPNGCVPPGEAGLYGSEANAGFRYAEVATKTGGIIGSICDVSFEQTLLKIAQALNTLKRIFPLTIKPIVGSIRVTVISAQGASSVIPNDPVTGFDYKAETNSVVFLGTYVPPPGSTVRIEYAFARL